MSPRDENSAATVIEPDVPGRFETELNAVAQPKSKSPAQTVLTPPEISVLTRAVRRGDAEAFSRLYDLYSFRLYKFLLVMTRGNENDAREIGQAVFIKLAKRCDVFDDEKRFWGWLCVLARNTFIDSCRVHQRLSRFVPLDELSGEPNHQANPERQLVEILRESLMEFSPEERELLQAAYVDKRALRELAEETEQTYKAVESRLARLRQKLKHKLLNDLRHENTL